MLAMASMNLLYNADARRLLAPSHFDVVTDSRPWRRRRR
jgi:hypothetical protein